MALAKVKTAEETARLEAIWAELEAMSDKLEELRKHEVEWDMAKARIKELESEINQLKTR